MKNFLSSVISATSGTAGTVAAYNSGDKILTYVMLAINIGTFLFTFILDCRRKWKEQDLEFKKKEAQNKTDGE